MKMTMKQINAPLFMSAIHQLDSCSKYETPQITWNIMKFVKGCRAVMLEQREFYQTKTKEFAKLDEKGEVMFERDQIVFKDAEAEKAHHDFFEGFMKTEAEVVVPMLELNEIGPAQLSPSQLAAIEPLVKAE